MNTESCVKNPDRHFFPLVLLLSYFDPLWRNILSSYFIFFIVLCFWLKIKLQMSYHYSVWVHDGVQSMCYCQNCAILEFTSYGLLNQGICPIKQNHMHKKISRVVPTSSHFIKHAASSVVRLHRTKAKFTSMMWLYLSLLKANTVRKWQI